MPLHTSEIYVIIAHQVLSLSPFNTMIHISKGVYIEREAEYLCHNTSLFPMTLSTIESTKQAY